MVFVHVTHNCEYLPGQLRRGRTYNARCGFLTQKCTIRCWMIWSICLGCESARLVAGYLDSDCIRLEQGSVPRHSEVGCLILIIERELNMMKSTLISFADENMSDVIIVWMITE